jgi:hypothetical protein
LTTPLVGLASDLKTNGYAIECTLTQLPTEKALVRSYARFFTEGRYVPREYIAGVGDSPQGTFDRLRSEGLIDRGSIFDTDVPRGQAPRPLENWPRKVAKSIIIHMDKKESKAYPKSVAWIPGMNGEFLDPDDVWQGAISRGVKSVVKTPVQQEPSKP